MLELLNDKVRKEEVKAYDLFKKLKPRLKRMVKNQEIGDYNIWEKMEVYSSDEAVCEKHGVEVGNPLYSAPEFTFGCDEEFFQMNWNEWKDPDGPVAKFHFGYAMHCILFHSHLDMDDILKIDDIWIEIKVDYQFGTRMQNDS